MRSVRPSDSVLWICATDIDGISIAHVMQKKERNPSALKNSSCPCSRTDKRLFHYDSFHYLRTTHLQWTRRADSSLTCNSILPHDIWSWRSCLLTGSRAPILTLFFDILRPRRAAKRVRKDLRTLIRYGSNPHLCLELSSSTTLCVDVDPFRTQQALPPSPLLEHRFKRTGYVRKMHGQLPARDRTLSSLSEFAEQTHRAL
jgi:hypothetical protein